ncbi:MAG TPA: VacJ family lipoprotein [Proteobacteria bacterium]|nr:putative phospholipid-binding lipoprotein MlaA precursor [bacterium BMS3Abin14]HDL53457.1 VacJ family lipoprotein [Pseudomonadota bacterium]
MSGSSGIASQAGICGFILLALLALSPALAHARNVAGTTVSTENGSLNSADDTAFDEDFGDIQDDGGGDSAAISDPFEPVNRGIFWFNDKLYFYLIKPAARVLRIVPEPARHSLGNFFSNLMTPIRFGSALLQFKFAGAETELGRFIVNTTVGVAGLFDPAEKWGMRKTDEDFGQVLGFYGLGPGFYIVWPVLGPSSLRGTAGLLGDTYMDPLYYYYIETDNEITSTERLAILGLDKLNTLSLDKDTYEAIKRDSIDPYLFIRNAYSQNREGRIKK